MSTSLGNSWTFQALGSENTFADLSKLCAIPLCLNQPLPRQGDTLTGELRK